MASDGEKESNVFHSSVLAALPARPARVLGGFRFWKMASQAAY